MSLEDEILPIYEEVVYATHYWPKRYFAMHNCPGGCKITSCDTRDLSIQGNIVEGTVIVEGFLPSPYSNPIFTWMLNQFQIKLK
jgi:hypothetical protein